MSELDDITIIKLGGSVITRKDSMPPEVNDEYIHRIAKELIGYDGKLIVVLGGGAHGHQAAHKYGYGDPNTSPNLLLDGIPHIRHNMTLLSTFIEQVFNKEGLPAVVLSPFMFVILNNDEIEKFPLEMIKNILSKNLVLIIHGDVCIDKTKSASILSGDTIAAYLARNLAAKRVLIGTNVDGVLETDPQVDPNAKYIPLINKSNQDLILKNTGPSSTTDVTGGMNKKIRELLTLANQNIEVVVFNLLVPGRLSDLLKGNSTVCTRIQ